MFMDTAFAVQTLHGRLQHFHGGGFEGCAAIPLLHEALELHHAGSSLVLECMFYVFQ